MHGYVVQITHEALGSAPPKLETVMVLAKTQPEALVLVRTALRLDGQPVQVARRISEAEAKRLELKPFQVKHA